MFKEALKFAVTQTKTLQKIGVKNAPVILAVAGVACLGHAVVKAWQNSPKAAVAFEEKKKECEAKGEKFGMKAAAMAIMKYVAPVALSATIGVGCIVGGTKISMDRIATLGAAYTIMATKNEHLKKFQDKAKELLGEKEVEKIKNEVVKENIKVVPEGLPMVSQDGKMWCVLNFGGFEVPLFSSRPEIERAMRELDRDDYYKDEFCPVSELLAKLDWECTDTVRGMSEKALQMLGWDLRRREMTGNRPSIFDSYKPSSGEKCGNICFVADFDMDFDEGMVVPFR